MSKFEEYMNRAKNLAEDAGDVAKNVAGVITDARAVKEIRQGIIELESLPEVEGSILYSMELGTMINDLKSLLLVVGDNRLDDGSVSEEIRKVMDKAALANDDSHNAEAQTMTDEQQAIETARKTTYETCSRALEALNC